MVGQIVRVFVSNRHDFVRRAQVLATNRDDLYVRWLDYSLPNEWIPARWL